ncbi:amino acid/amide ABC transporter membrane protein 2 (HAAT family) [Prauserella shujinwangii]|uniref:Amino acid/amide ABC transporter membrane protein 2 (HAAT family) n=1 Tax=Prauserella shujinwangii TaxID=1453103 RepID=A0A2T0LNG5_9PSEU|nr:branched-chain amino acid ABC transporter permease [Prauserella shujinwangii]PRX44720.1 amino acid/amide ABC transporter membrane protein 2 (HAAT family) [Prauserella shujinwangii]
MWWVRALLWLALLIVLLALPLYLEAQWLRAGEYMMVGAVGAIGLTLLTGQAGQLSLAHAFFLLAGGTAYTVLAGGQEGERNLVGFNLPPLLALLGAVAITALLGIAFAPVAGRLRGIYLGVASLALVFLGLYFGQAAEGLTGGTSTGRAPEPFSLFGFEFSNEGDLEILGVPFRQSERVWYLFLGLLLIAFLLALGAVRSRVGRSWRAVRDNEAAAAVMGVSVARAKAGAFAVSSAYAGLAGVMTVLWFDILKPDESEFGTYGINVSIAFLAMVIIGGLGSVPGALVGAVVVNGLPQVLALYSTKLGWFTGTGEGAFTPVLISSFVYGAAIILVVLFEPGGLAAIGRRIAGRLSNPARGRE